MGNWLLGSLLDFQNDPLGFLQAAASTHGDFVPMRFAYIRACFLNHPDLIEDVLLRNADKFDKDTRSAKKMRSTCGDSLLSGSTNTWERHRALVQPVFQPKQIAETGPAIDRQVEVLLSRLHEVAKSGEAINLQDELMAFVMNVIADTLFGEGIDTDELEQHLTALIDDTWRRISVAIDPSDLSPALHRKKFKVALQSVDHMALSIIAKRRQSGASCGDLLDRLLKANDKATATDFDDQELRDALVTLLLSGHDTTANALCWALYHMAKSTDDNIVNSDPSLIFQEAVRLYPSIWIVERCATETLHLGAHSIPKGTMVLISPYVLHRHPSFWPNAERFDPERFSKEAVKTRPRNSYIPFGLGKHRCIGLHLANLIAQKVISAVQQNFHIEILDGESPRPNPSLTLGISHDTFMRLKPA